MAREQHEVAQLPPLGDFEDGDDLTAIITPRRSRDGQPPAPQHIPAGPTAAQRSSKPQPTPTDEMPAAPADETPAASGEDEPAPVTHDAVPSTPRMRPSVVHIPSALIDRVTAARDARRWTTGQLLVAAIEQAEHDGHLDRTFGIDAPAEPDDGGVFGGWFTPTRPPRTDEGPTSPLNIRLPENYYSVIDRLVAAKQATSRSRLAAAALQHYLMQDNKAD